MQFLFIIQIVGFIFIPSVYVFICCHSNGICVNILCSIHNNSLSPYQHKYYKLERSLHKRVQNISTHKYTISSNWMTDTIYESVCCCVLFASCHSYFGHFDVCDYANSQIVWPKSCRTITSCTHIGSSNYYISCFLLISFLLLFFFFLVFWKKKII